MTIRARVYLLFGPLFTFLATPACYTLLKHPKVKRDTVYEDVSSNRCTTCHYDDEIWQYQHPSNQIASYDPTCRAWDDYYLVPWWYTTSWYYDPVGARTVPLRSRGVSPQGTPDNDVMFHGGTFGPPPRQNAAAPTASAGQSTEKATTDEDSSKKRSVRQTSSRHGKTKEKK